MEPASPPLIDRRSRGGLGTDVGKALAGRESLRCKLQRCAEVIADHLDPAVVHIWTLDDDSTLELQASAGTYATSPGRDDSRIPVGQGPIGQIAGEGLPHLSDDVAGDPRVPDREWARREGMVAFAGHPLMVGDRLVGVLAVFARYPLAASTVASMASVADQIAVGVEQARLFDELKQAEHRYRELVQSLEAIVWEADAENLALTFVSQRAEELLGYPLERWVDDPPLWPGIVHADDRGAVVGRFRQAATEKHDHEFDCRVVAADGRVVDLYVMVFVVAGKRDRPARLRGLMVDVTRRKQAERRGRVHRAVDRVLAEAGTRVQLFPALLAAIAEPLGWQAANLWVVDGEADELVCAEQWQSPAVDLTEFVALSRELSLPAGTGVPGRVWASGQPVWVEDLARSTYPRAEAALAGGLRGGLAFPIRVVGRFFGVMECFSEQVQPLDEDLLAGMDAIGNQVGQYLARKRAEDQLRTTVAQLRRRSGQLRGLTAAALAINSTLNVEDILRVVTDRARELIGAHQAVTTVIRGDDWSAAMTAVSLSEKYAAWRDQTTDPDASGMDVVVRETNQPLRLTQDELEAHPRWQSLGAAESLPPPRGWLAAPLVAPDGTNLGLVQLSDRFAGEFSEDDEAVLVQLAQLASVSIHHARLYEERDQIAEALEHGLRPPRLPVVPGFHMAARYSALGKGVRAGGDFYDVFAVGDGRWAVVLGDVCGKGPEAAAITGLARHTVRAVAMSRPEPHQVFGVLNHALMAEDTDRFCALAYGLLERGDTVTRMDLSCAGNPLPLVLRANGVVEQVGVPGLLLGMFEGFESERRSVELAAGDSVVLFTDGLLDDRGRADTFDEATLRSLLASNAGASAEGIAEALQASVIEAPLLRDDVAILVIQIASQSDTAPGVEALAAPQVRGQYLRSVGR